MRVEFVNDARPQTPSLTFGNVSAIWVLIGTTGGLRHLGRSRAFGLVDIWTTRWDVVK